MKEPVSGNPNLTVYCEQGKLMKPLSYRALICMRLIDLFCNSSAWYKNNVVINPDTGEINFYTPYTGREFVPFETSEDSRWSQEGYALAVNIALVLIGSHPYKGKVWYETPLMTPEKEKEILTTEDFILATNSRAANAPQIGVQDHVKTLFNNLTSELRQELKSVFKRDPDATPWFDKESTLYESSRKLREQLWYIVRNSLPAGPEYIRVVVDGYEYLLSPGKSLISPQTLECLGHCEARVNNSGAKCLAFVSDRDKAWTWTKNENRLFPKKVRKGDAIAITEDMVFDSNDRTIRAL